jgi:uncharacterized protein (TIGR04540 family)
VVVNLDLKLFYKTQRELAIALNFLIDAYWESQVTEETLIGRISDIYINNPEKVLKDHQFTTVLKQHCGKRRLQVVSKVLEMHKLKKEDQSAM